MNESFIHIFFFFSVNIYIMTFFPISTLFKESEIKFPSKEGILILTTSTIEEAFNQYHNLAIIFFSYHSYNNPLFSEVKKIVKSKLINDFNLTFGKINGEHYNLISKKYNISEFPKIVLFSNGVKKDIYKGNIDKDSIIEWFYKRLKSPIYLIESINDINKYQNNNKFNYIYFGQNENNINIYKNFSLTQNIKFGLCHNSSIIKKYGLIQPESAVFYKPFDEPPYVITKNITFENLEKIILENSHPFIYKDTKELYYISLNKSEPAFFFLRNSSDVKVDKYDEIIRKKVMKYKGKIKFCKSDINENFTQYVLNESKIFLYEGNFPTALILDYDNNINRWDFNDFFENFNETNLDLFIKYWIEKKLKFLKLKSEEVPGKQERGKVFKVVHKTFKRDVLDNILNVFVKFYLPNDTLCKEIEPLYEDLAKKLKVNGNIRIAEYNLEKNHFNYIKIEHYPTFILFRAGFKGKNELLEYKGENKVYDMMYFVLTNQAFPSLNKKKEKIEEKNKKEKNEDL